MVTTTICGRKKEDIIRIQELVKLLELKTFRFIRHYECNGLHGATYECEVDELNRLNSFFYQDEIKPWSKWKKIWYKVKEHFNGK
jgi:hypothetical protein